MNDEPKEPVLLCDFDNGQYTVEDLCARTVCAVADALESVPGALKPGHTNGWTHLYGADADEMQELCEHWDNLDADEDQIGQWLSDAVNTAECNAGPLILVECDGDTGMTTIWSLVGLSQEEIDAWSEAREAR